MPRKKYKITKLTKSKRWRKKYLGVQYYFPLSDYPTEEAAWDAWLQKKTQIDLENQRTKSHKADYENAIRDRQDLAAWCREAGDHNQAKVFQQESERLLSRFNRMGSPPPLTVEEADPLSSVIARRLAEIQEEIDNMPADERVARIQPMLVAPDEPGYGKYTSPESEIGTLRQIWQDRLKRFERTAPEKSISAHIDTYLNQKRARATGEQISLGYWAVLHAHMKRFESWIGSSFPVESISAKTLIDYHLELMKLVQQEKISRKYAADNMATVRGFIRWAWELELCGLPRNIDSKELRFNVTVGNVEIFAEDELRKLLSTPERTRLFVLLALNCGFTQGDLAALRQDEVDWEDGRITRKRTKTKQHKSVPTVCYKLWPTTFDLLRKHRSTHEELVFLNKQGRPLKMERVEEGGGYIKSDTVRHVWERLREKLKLTKHYKHLRKTGATTLGKHKHYKSFVPLYLGHAPRSIAERHYAAPSQKLFDEAICWLGRELGVVKSDAGG